MPEGFNFYELLIRGDDEGAIKGVAVRYRNPETGQETLAADVSDPDVLTALATALAALTPA